MAASTESRITGPIEPRKLSIQNLRSTCRRSYVCITNYMRAQSPPRRPIKPHPLGFYCLRPELQILETLNLTDLLNTTRSLDGFEAAIQWNFDRGLLPLDDVIGALIMYERAMEWTLMEHEELGGSMW